MLKFSKQCRLIELQHARRAIPRPFGELNGKCTEALPTFNALIIFEPSTDKNPMTSPSLHSLHAMVWTALMAALIAMGSFLSLPLGPVPFSMQPFFVLLASFVLGWPQGVAACLLFVAAGIIGLPVFAGGKSGLAVLFGPTGGYILGFVLAAGVIGLMTKARKPSWALGLLAGTVGLTLLYFCGVANLGRVLQISWQQALVIGFYPFILQDLLKLVMAVAAWRIMDRRGLLPQ